MGTAPNILAGRSQPVRACMVFAQALSLVYIRSRRDMPGQCRDSADTVPGKYCRVEVRRGPSLELAYFGASSPNR
jgi:hypothetical protein